MPCRPPIALALTVVACLLAGTRPTSQGVTPPSADWPRVIVLVRAAPSGPHDEAHRFDGVPPVGATATARNAWRARRDLSLSSRLEARHRDARERVGAAIEARGGRVTHRFAALPGLAAAVPPSLVAWLSDHPDVVGVHDDRRRAARLATLPATLGLAAFDAPGFDGGTVDVAMVDSGLYMAHPALAPLEAAGRIRSILSLAQACPAANCGPDNPFEDPTSPDDFQGHGTAVAGVLASQGWSLFPAHRGVAAGLRTLVNIKALTAGGFYDSDIIGGLDAALVLDGDDAPEIVSASLGAVAFREFPEQDPYDRELLAQFFDAIAFARHKVVVVAAGNAGPSAESVESPAIGYNVLAVGATDATGPRASHVIWPQSARGPARGAANAPALRRKPDLVAPGHRLRTTDYLGGLTSGTLDDAAVGTSLAAPVVAGVAARLFDAPGLGDASIDETRKALAVRALLINSAEDRNALHPVVTTPDGWDPTWGWGYVDAARAHAERGFVRGGTVSAGGARRYFRRTSAGPTKATLAWDRAVSFRTTDPAPEPLANLDLRLYSLTTGVERAASTSSVDNVEQVVSSAIEAAVLVIDAAPAYSDTPFVVAANSGFDPVAAPSLSIAPISTTTTAPGALVRLCATVRNLGGSPGLPVFGVTATLSVPPGVVVVDGTPTLSIGSLDETTSALACWVVRAPASTGVATFSVQAMGGAYGAAFADAVDGEIVTSAVCSTATLTPSALAVPQQGGSSTIVVSGLASECAWAAVASAPWLEVTSGAFGTGAGAITLEVAPNPAPSARVATLTVGPRSLEVTQAPAERAYYLAEGATGPFFELDIIVANPNDAPVDAEMTFLRPGGATTSLPVTIGARAQRTVRVNDVPGLADTAVSTIVRSPSGAPLIVERTMFWGASAYGGHGGTAVDGPLTVWYFAEGSQGFFDTFVLLANASPDPANVTVRFLREGGEPPFTVPVEVLGNSRKNVWAREYPELANRSFSIVVESDRPIIAERAMYFPGDLDLFPGRRFWEGGHGSAGVAAPATSWFHAEGATGPLFDAYILVGNPEPTPTTVTFTFLLSTGETVVVEGEVAGESRFTLPIETVADDVVAGRVSLVEGHPERLRDAAVSTTVTASSPILSERAMYWAGGFTAWHEAHNSFGVTSTAVRWGLAEGRVGGPREFDTFILIANPHADAIDVRVTLLRQEGRPTLTRTFGINPTSRFNVHVNDAEWANAGLLPGEAFGAIVESLDPSRPIVVERAMYWSESGIWWSGGTNATAVPLP